MDGDRRPPDLVDILDGAYTASEDPEHFDRLVDTVRAYFFDAGDPEKLSEHFPRFAGLNSHLERHIPRLETMLRDGADNREGGLTLDRHARVTFDKDGYIQNMTSEAQEVFGSARHISDLPLTHESHTALEELRVVFENSGQVEQLLHLKTNTQQPTTAFAFCVSNASAHTITMNLSRFEWTDALLRHLQNALDLTPSEGEVLQGVLTGMSYKSIAQSRGRSYDTVKSQGKSLLRKTGCAKTDEIVQLCTGIAYVTALAGGGLSPHDDPPLWQAPRDQMHEHTLSDGRKITWYEYGNSQGIPILWIHGFIQGPFFTRTMREALKENNIRLIAPARPGFGFTSQSESAKNYDDTVIQDTLTLLSTIKLAGPLLMAIHQGGASHGFRIRNALGERVKKMIMIDAGIPITPEHYKTMDARSRLAAVATRHAPSVMKMMASTALKHYKKHGAEKFLRQQFEENPNIPNGLDDPETLRLQEQGCWFLTQQGVDSFIRDGSAAMSDWTADLEAAAECAQHWHHPRDCLVMGSEHILNRIKQTNRHTITIWENTGFSILYTRPDLICEALAQNLSPFNPSG